MTYLNLDTTKFEERAINEFLIGSLPYCFLFILLIVRTCKIFPIPSQKLIIFPISLKLKIIFSFLIAILTIIRIVFAFIFEEFWLHEYIKCLSLIYICHFIVIFFQILTIYYEFKKQIPSVWYIHLLFWILIFVISIYLFIDSVFFLDGQNNIFILIDFFYFLFSFSLISLGIIYKQDIQNFNEFLKEKLILYPNKNRKKYEENKAKQVKIFKMKISIKPVKRRETFQINVDLTNIQYNIFKELSEIKKILMSLPTHSENPIDIDFDDLNSEIIENYLSFYIENEIFLTESIILFLSIPDPYKRILIKRIKKTSVNNADQSFLSVSSHKSDISKENSKAGLLFFDVEFIKFEKSLDKTHYDFEFSLLFFPNNTKCIIIKRFNDFIKLEENLKKTFNYVPKLTNKTLLIKDDDNLLKRAKIIEEYLLNILNERPFFIEPLYNFLENNLKKNELFIYDVKNYFSNEKNFFIYDDFFYNYNCKIIDNKMLCESSENQYVIYIIKIEKFNKENNCYEEKNQIIKRYSDFDKLHEFLSLKYKNIEDLPKKFGFLNDQQVEGRKEGLEHFLNSVCKLKKIEESFIFRRFMEINLNEFKI